MESEATSTFEGDVAATCAAEGDSEALGPRYQSVHLDRHARATRARRPPPGSITVSTTPCILLEGVPAQQMSR